MKAGGKQSAPYSSTQKIEALCSFKMLVDVQQTTWHHIPEDSILQLLNKSY
jgi:hypothetical protein